ncbi:hypothetical protein KBX53_16910, partial [Micromonospora sp. M51]|nr:hypothetical protein [Micromonospora sp. M51]
MLRVPGPARATHAGAVSPPGRGRAAGPRLPAGASGTRRATADRVGATAPRRIARIAMAKQQISRQQQLTEQAQREQDAE